MTRSRPSLLLAALFPALSSALCSTQDCKNLTAYGLTLDEFNEVFFSEAPEDYGPDLSSDETDALWLEGTNFEHGLSFEASEKAGIDPEKDKVGLDLLSPYILCNFEPNKSGNERRKQTLLYFEEAGVGNNLYRDENAVFNDDEKTCWVVQSLAEEFLKVYETVPDSRAYMKVQPASSSMKMVKETFDKTQYVLGCTVTQCPDTENIVFGLKGEVCPGVMNLTNNNETEVIETVRNFMTGDDGAAVYNASFFTQLIAGVDSGYSKVSKRMDFWSDIITFVEGNTTGGENYCLDQIEDRMILEFGDDDTLILRWKQIVDDTESFENLDTCVWWSLQAFALHPYVCRTEASEIIVIREPLRTLGLTLEEYNKILISESNEDYGPDLNDEEGEELWEEGTVFEHDRSRGASDLAGIDVVNDPPVGLEFLSPYILCNSIPNLSANKRWNQTIKDFEEAGVGKNIHRDDNFFYNTEALSCLFMLSLTAEFAKVYEIVNATQSYMETQPVSSSMKMVEGTVEAVENRIQCTKDDNCAAYSTTNGGEQVLSLVSSVCPGVMNLTGYNETAVIDTITQFMTEDDGLRVYEASFFTQLIADTDSGFSKVSKRMTFWSDIITSVAKGNKKYCLDEVKKRMGMHFGDDHLFLTWKIIGDTPDFERLETCVWWMVQSFVLHPYVCRTEPQNVVVTLVPAPKPTPAPTSSGSSLTVGSFFGMLSSVMATAMSVVALLAL